MRDAMSAMVLKIPEIWSTERRLAWQACNRVAKSVRMFAAKGETLLQNLWIQVTAARLSHQKGWAGVFQFVFGDCFFKREPVH